MMKGLMKPETASELIRELRARDYRAKISMWQDKCLVVFSIIAFGGIAGMAVAMWTQKMMEATR